VNDDGSTPRWPTPWVRAALGTAILSAVEREPLHGYGIATALQEAGFGRPKGGSLYPLLAVLEEDGSLSAAWEHGTSGPGRRTYTLTDAGRVRLASERTQWAALVAALSDDRPEDHDADA
jgi:PadR family transcriptional regulator PadR